MTERPIKCLGRHRVDSPNVMFDIFLDHISDGISEVPYYLVVQPKHSGNGHTTGVAVLPERGGMVGLQRMFRHAVDCWVLEVPRGFTDPGETDAEAALRELAEETGLVATHDQLIPLGTILPEPGVLTGRIALFVARGCEVGPPTDHRELGIGELSWVRLEDALGLADTSAIEDPSTIGVLYRYARAVQGE